MAARRWGIPLAVAAWQLPEEAHTKVELSEPGIALCGNPRLPATTFGGGFAP